MSIKWGFLVWIISNTIYNSESSIAHVVSVVWAIAEEEGVQWDLVQSSSRDQDWITQKLHHSPALNGMFIQQPLTQLSAQVPAGLTDGVVIRWDLHALLFRHLSCPNIHKLWVKCTTYLQTYEINSIKVPCAKTKGHTLRERKSASLHWCTILFQDQRNQIKITLCRNSLIFSPSLLV